MHFAGNHELARAANIADEHRICSDEGGGGRTAVQKPAFFLGHDAFLSYWGDRWCDELGVAARWQTEVESAPPRTSVECENGHQTSVFGPLFGRRIGPVRMQPPAER